METNTLRAFITFAQTEHVRKASELLGVTAGSLSKTLHGLEEELGVKLMTPVGRQVVLSPEGRAFLPRARALLDDWESLKKSMQGESEQQKRSPLRLATFEVFSTYFLSGLDHIQWQRGLKLFEAVPGEIERLILDERVDLGITYLPVPHPRLDFLKIAKVEMGVFVKKGSFRDLPQEEIPFVVPVAPLSGTPTKAKGLDGWPETAYERDILFEVTLMESGLELCRQGKCAGYFPVFVVEEHNKRVKAEYELVRKSSPTGAKKTYADVYLVKSRARAEDELVKKMARMIRMVCKV